MYVRMMHVGKQVHQGTVCMYVSMYCMYVLRQYETLYCMYVRMYVRMYASMYTRMNEGSTGY